MISKGRVFRTGLFFALANFLATAGIGVLLRVNTVFPLPNFTDRYWIHAHSHTGFLGWLFMVLATLGFSMFLPKNAMINRRMYRLIIYLQLAVLGMLVTFPIMGYAAPSILFSTVHMILSILFVLLFFKHAEKADQAARFVKAGLVFMVISSLGPLALGPIIAGGMRDTALYNMAIYFYLHFQYNGWFTLAVFGFLLKLMDQSGMQTNQKRIKLFYRLLLFSIVMTLALSFFGFDTSAFVWIVGSAGALLQLWAGYMLLRILFLRTDLSKILENTWIKWFLGLALFSWLLKIMLQFLSVIPVMTDFAYVSRDAIMTYLHLSFLGFIGCFVIGLLISKRYLSVFNPTAKAGFMLFLIGVVLMELTIGMRAIPQYLSLELYKALNLLLLFESAILLISLFIMLFYAFILPARGIKQRRFS